MTAKKTVFASRSERHNYYKLRRVWGDKYQIYHNLPFLNVLNTQELFDLSDFRNIRRITITEQEFARLKKTSIDYTLCDEQDAPILCIEFDGFQEGVNVGTEYFADHSIHPDPWRQEIMELKLRVAHGSLFPYFIVSSEQFNDLSADIKLTIVDGIIGEVLATKATQAKIGEGFDPNDLGFSADEFEALSPDLQNDLLQDWVIGIEVETEFEHNPITRKRGELERELIITSFSFHYLTKPDINESTTIKERIAASDKILLSGAAVTLHTPDFGDIESSIWIPNFKAPFFSEMTLVEDIAFILAAEKLRQKRSAAH